MSRPLYLSLSRNAYAANVQRIRKLHPNNKVMAVIKCNAYGHDIENLYPAFKNVDALALIEFARAQKLRHLGWTKSIVMLEGGFSLDNFKQAQHLALDVVVHCFEQINWLEQLPREPSLRIFLKCNSGMNRLGFTATDYRQAYRKLQRLPVVSDIVHTTHFANADSQENTIMPSIAEQQAAFFSIIEGLDGEISCANSAACFAAELTSREQWLRPGLALYGLSPLGNQCGLDLGLQPALALHTNVIAIQKPRAGDTVGYGSCHRFTKDATIAVLACGYGDGYPRSSGYQVRINGNICPLVGRVSMDMLTVDISHCADNVRIGSTALLWGRHATLGYLPLEELAANVGTISYEIACDVNARVERINVD